MTQPFTKENAKNIFYGGTVFFLLLFLVLVVNTFTLLPEGNQSMLNLATADGMKIAQGKFLWEKYDCIGCHSLLGEGAYFAPELGNVYKRYDENIYGIKEFIRSRPVRGVLSRRSMPQFNFTEDELNAIAEFLKYDAYINTLGWPPNREG